MEVLKIKAQLKADHFEEIKTKDEKISVLKKQIALSFKDNSWYAKQLLYNYFANQSDSLNF